jgi:hypothetical protein
VSDPDPFPGTKPGHVTPTGLWHTNGTEEATISPPEVKEAPTESPNYYFKADAGKLIVVSESTGDSFTVPLSDGGDHSVTTFDPKDVRRLQLYTVLGIETKLVADAKAVDPPKRRVWTIPNKRIDEWLGGKK